MDQPTGSRRVMSLADGLGLIAQMRDMLENAPGDENAFVRFCLNNVARSRAQHFQDLWVIHETQGRRDGYFVEFGALDGVIYSNSFALEQILGWNGIVAEPSRIWHDQIREKRTCAVDLRCVWTRSGEMVRFNQTPITGLSTIDAYSDKDGHAAKRAEGERYDVETVSLNDLLAEWKAPRRIDYLSIDTEGSEFDILSAFDWDRHKIGLITVEMNSPEMQTAIHELLTAKGYERKFEAYSRDDGWYKLKE
jgi:FkbM family methyltransferase